MEENTDREIHTLFFVPIEDSWKLPIYIALSLALALSPSRVRMLFCKIKSIVYNTHKT